MAEPMTLTDAVVVLVTAPTAEKAAEIARQLVEEKLAACGNVLGGLRSIYAWQGQVHDGQNFGGEPRQRNRNRCEQKRNDPPFTRVRAVAVHTSPARLCKAEQAPWPAA